MRIVLVFLFHSEGEGSECFKKVSHENGSRKKEKGKERKVVAGFWTVRSGYGSLQIHGLGIALPKHSIPIQAMWDR